MGAGLTGQVANNYSLLTHCGWVTQICVFTLQLCKTDDANLRVLHALGFPRTLHLITQKYLVNLLKLFKETQYKSLFKFFKPRKRAFKQF
jgi:hypothetical protein